MIVHDTEHRFRPHMGCGRQPARKQIRPVRPLVREEPRQALLVDRKRLADQRQRSFEHGVARHHAVDHVFHRRVDVTALDREAVENFQTQRGRHPPEHEVGQTHRQFRPCQYRRLQFRFGRASPGERFDASVGKLRRAVFEEAAGKRRIAHFDENVGDGARQVLAMREHLAMPGVAFAGDMDEVAALQGRAFREQHPGDVDAAERERKREFAGRLDMLGKALGQAHPHLRVEPRRERGQHRIEEAALLRRNERGRQQREVREAPQHGVAVMGAQAFAFRRPVAFERHFVRPVGFLPHWSTRAVNGA